jgi:hypothetical protein
LPVARKVKSYDVSRVDGKRDVFLARGDPDLILGEQAPGLAAEEMEAPLGVVVGEVGLAYARGPTVAVVVVRRYADAQEVHLVIPGELLHWIEDTFGQKREPAVPGAAVKFVFAKLGRKWIGNRVEIRRHIRDRVVLPVYGFRSEEAAPGQLDTVDDARCLGWKRFVRPIRTAERRRDLGFRLFRLGRLLLGLDELALDLPHLLLQLLHLALHAVDLVQVRCRRLGVGRTCSEYCSGREQPPMTFQHRKLPFPMTPRHGLSETNPSIRARESRPRTFFHPKTALFSECSAGPNLTDTGANSGNTPV